VNTILKTSFFKFKKAILFVFAFLFVTNCQVAIAQSVDSLAIIATIKAAQQALASDPQIVSGQHGFLLISLDHNKVILEDQSSKSFAPASTLKLLSTATALEVLGPNFRFKTTYGYSGDIVGDGILDGDVIVKGSGDPSLSSNFTEPTMGITPLCKKIAKTIVAIGVKTIYGKVIVDNSFYNGFIIPDGYPVGDIGNYYGAAVFATNIFDNSLEVLFEPGKKGSKAYVKSIYPADGSFDILNEITVAAAGTGDQTVGYSFPFGKSVLFKGTIPESKKPFKIRISMPNPPLLLANYLQQALAGEQLGIRNDYEVSTSPIKFKTIDTLYSNPVKDLVNNCNLYSLNHYAGGLLMASAHKAANVRDLNAALAWSEKYWKAKGIDIGSNKLYDGSGLSPSNGITINNMGHLLSYIAKQSYGQHLIEGLPTLGSTGTLTDAAPKSATNSRIKAKTGSIAGVYNFAGYVMDSKTGKPKYAFVIFNNRFTGNGGNFKRKCGKLMSALGTLP
jgi:D-alanyl-D-alanine carboxypeptidase/D-alanyl-D-alanine-endopeptidase (penicillin-binding protein 4)